MTGWAICGSFCSFTEVFRQLEAFVAAGNDVLPIMSETAASTDTRFFSAVGAVERLESICGKKAVRTIADAEPLGPAKPLELLIIAPCTGNTLAKLSCGITDTAVCMAAKAHLRSDRPLVIALATNDALSANFQNIAKMSQRRHVYFVPMVRDDIESKPHSMVARFDMIAQTAERARRER